MSYEKPEADSFPIFQNYDDALKEITALGNQRIIFVIDEYPYLAKAKPAISAMLQHLIDHKWCDSKILFQQSWKQHTSEHSGTDPYSCELYNGLSDLLLLLCLRQNASIQSVRLAIHLQGLLHRSD